MIFKPVENDKIYDQDIVKVFSSIVVPYPSGSGVELVTGERA